MLRRYSSLWNSLFIAADLAVSVAVFLGAYVLRFQPWVISRLPVTDQVPPLSIYLRLAPVLALVLFLTNRHYRLYSPRREESPLEEFLDLWRSNIAAVLLLIAYLFFDRTHAYARVVVGIFAVVHPFAVFLFRAAVRAALRQARRQGYNLRHIVIVGTGRTAQALVHRIRRNPWTGLRIVGLVGDGTEKVGRKIHGVEVIGAVGEIEELLQRQRPDQVYIALSGESTRAMEPLVRTLIDHRVDLRIVPDLGLLLGLHHRTVDFDGLPVATIWESPIEGWGAVSKRAVDFGIAFVSLVVLAPLLVLIALLVKITSRGPILYRQQRMGLDGRVFSLLKFRSMRQAPADGVPAADPADDGGWTTRGDARCTPLGRLLRSLSLDELPQLYNVLLGQMSLVGPRPERPLYIEKFKRSIPRYMLRHKVKAGLTGWAQINGWRGDTSLKKRIQYDLYYLKHWSLGFDLKILLLTLVRGFLHPNAY